MQRKITLDPCLYMSLIEDSILHDDFRATFGNHRSVGQGVSEMRVREGQACRLYYTIRDNTTIILLCGGDKSGQLRQQRDIERAHQMARDWK